METNAARFIVESGDFVFIPADCPHQVRTLSPRSVGVSSNFVDGTNLDVFLRSVATTGAKSLASALANALMGKSKIPPMLRDPPELKYSDHATYGKERPWERGAAAYRA